jgi:hypothetical protein
LVDLGRASSFEIALRTLKDVPEGVMTLSPAPLEDGAEVAALREEVAVLTAALAELREEVAAIKVLPPTAEPKQAEEPTQTPVPEGQAEPEHPPERTDGVLVRAARWLERLLRWK